MKKPNLQPLLLWLRRGAMIALVVASTYCCSPRRGFLSTLPLISLACLISSLIYYAPKYTVALAALCAFSFTLADGSGTGYAVLIALFASLTAYLGTLAAKQLALLSQRKRILPLVFALLLLCPAPLLQSFLFGTPWQNLAEHTQFSNYLKSTYPSQEFSELRTYYNVQTANYEALVRFPGGKDVVLEDVLTKKDGLLLRENDGFFKRFCQRGMEQQQSTFVNLIRSRYPQEKLWLECKVSPAAYQLPAPLEGSFGSVPQWLKDSTALDLGFQFSIADAKSFLSYAKEYLQYVNDADFPYEQLRFFGGDQGVYRYTLTVTPETSPEELASLLRNCKISMNISSISLEYSYLF